MTWDLWIILLIACGGVAHVWYQRMKEIERRRFDRTRGKYGQPFERS